MPSVDHGGGGEDLRHRDYSSTADTSDPDGEVAVLDASFGFGPPWRQPASV
jgi:hypothetical protein